jgi:hypothetical protein
MSTLGLYGSATYSETLTGIEQMMTVLPDNTANQITARNVRDVVLTLYDDIQSVSASASSIPAPFLYTNPDLSSETIGGWPSGSSFNNVSLQTMFDTMFYKYVPPIISISAIPNQLEFGSTQPVVLTMNVTAKRNTVTSGNLLKPSGVPNPDPVLSGTLTSGVTSGPLTRTVSPILNITNTFTFSVSDLNTSVIPSTGSANNNTTCSVTWANRRYWGVIDLSAEVPSNPNLTLNPSATASIAGLFTDTLILGLTGAGYGLGNEISSTRAMTKTMSGGGNYLVFAWPTSFGTPTFYTGSSIPNSAFTKIRSNSSFTNINGYSGTNYDVWISNTQYYASTSIQIT